jgi:hypothetical protein
VIGRPRGLAVALVTLHVLALAGSHDVAHARSLAGSLHRFIENNSGLFFGVADTLTPTIERLAARGTSLPATSSAPGVYFSFDYDAGVTQREVTSFPPVFVETPQTVGARRLALTATYLHASLDEFDGEDLAEQIQFRSRIRNSQGTIRTVLDFEDLTVGTDALTFSATYGLTERWDVGMLLPLLSTTLDARARSVGRIGDDPPTIDEVVSVEADAFGAGDLLLRSKYRVTAREASASLATGLVLALPTGDPSNFRGIGDWTVQPYLAAARAFAGHDVHASLGFEANADDLERSRVHYAIGGSVRLVSFAAILVDVVGSSGVADDEFEITASGTTPTSHFLERFQTRPPEIDASGRLRVFSSVPRADIVDLSTVVKLRIGDYGTAFAGALIPIVKDGLRADIIPTAGFEYSF